MIEKLQRGPYPKTVIDTGRGRYIVDGKNWISVSKEATIEEIETVYAETTTIPSIKISLRRKVDLPLRQWEVQSSTETDTVYTIRIWAEGGWTCDCIGFSFRKNCKHVDKCKEIVNAESSAQKGNTEN